MLSLGLVALPLLSGPPGVATALNYSRNVEFCESCHTPMHSYVANMQDTESESLAAVHYRKHFIASDQCYACHTDAGIAGAVHAKLDGIVDLYKFYFGTFRTPIVMRRPYANAYCLKCHRNTTKYDVVKDHVRYQAVLFANKRPCMDCHAEAAPAHQSASSTASEGDRAQ